MIKRIVSNYPFGYLKFLSRYLFSCLHLDTSSFRLLISLFFSLKRHMASFSDVQRLQVWEMLLYPVVFRKIDHLSLYVWFESLSSHIYLDNSVSFSYCLCLNDFVWFANRSLKCSLAPI